MRRVCPPSARRRCIALAPLVLLLLAMALVLPSAARATTRPHVIVSLTFDDGFESVWSARPILQQYDMHATFYLNSGLLNRTGRLTDAQVRELAADGDEIGGHTVQHLHLPSLDPAEAKRQICNDRVALAGITGRAPTDFAYPFSETSPAVDADVAACGYNSGRLVGGISSQHCGPTCPYAETIPPAKPYALRTGVSVVPSTSVTAPEAQITAALHHGGGWVILVFHNYCDGCSGISVNPATFKTLLAWLHKMQSQGVQVQTVHQVIGGPTRTLVEGPPPRSGATVLNPSLETAASPYATKEGFAASIGEASLCWEQDTYGSNDATYERVRDAHSGRWADQINVTRYSSGDAKVIVAQDIGTCSIQVQPGYTYLLSAWYTGTAPTRLDVFYFNAQGGWGYGASSSFSAPSTGWRQITWTTPPVPVGAERMSFGLALAAVGHLTVDDFGLTTGQNVVSVETTTSNNLRYWLAILAIIVLSAGLIVVRRLRARAHG